MNFLVDLHARVNLKKKKILVSCLYGVS